MVLGFAVIVGFIAVILGLVALSALLTMWAWNLVVAGLFHGPVLGFWHAVAVNVLAGLVSSGFHYVRKN